MSSKNGEDDIGGRQTMWEGYADYQRVSGQFASSVEAAVEAYSYLDSAHTANAPVTPQDAAEARGRIKSAMMKVLSEIRREENDNDLYDEILDRWEDGTEDVDEGYIRAFEAIDLQNSCPGFLFDLVIDIRSAAWQLGYLQAGRTTKTESENPVETESLAMFEEA